MQKSKIKPLSNPIVFDIYCNRLIQHSLHVTDPVNEYLDLEEVKRYCEQREAEESAIVDQIQDT